MCIELKTINSKFKFSEYLYHLISLKPLILSLSYLSVATCMKTLHKSIDKLNFVSINEKCLLLQYLFSICVLFNFRLICTWNTLMTAIQMNLIFKMMSFLHMREIYLMQFFPLSTLAYPFFLLHNIHENLQYKYTCIGNHIYQPDHIQPSSKQDFNFSSNHYFPVQVETF